MHPFFLSFLFIGLENMIPKEMPIVVFSCDAYTLNSAKGSNQIHHISSWKNLSFVVVTVEPHLFALVTGRGILDYCSLDQILPLSQVKCCCSRFCIHLRTHSKTTEGNGSLSIELLEQYVGLYGKLICKVTMVPMKSCSDFNEFVETGF